MKTLIAYLWLNVAVSLYLWLAIDDTFSDALSWLLFVVSFLTATRITIRYFIRKRRAG
jgi:hypothetical protein